MAPWKLCSPWTAAASAKIIDRRAWTWAAEMDRSPAGRRPSASCFPLGPKDQAFLAGSRRTHTPMLGGEGRTHISRPGNFRPVRVPAHADLAGLTGHRPLTWVRIVLPSRGEIVWR